MNDSCEGRVKEEQVLANQVFALEVPTAMLDGALEAFERKEGQRPVSLCE